MLQGFDAILLVLDHHGKILHYKAGDGSHLLNADFPEPPPMKFQDLVSGEVERKYENAVRELRNGGKLALFDYMLDLLSGAVWCESYLMRFTEDQNIMVVWNVTKRKKPFVEESLPDCDGAIQGWMRALHLRDYEAKDHAQRVTEMTLRFACQVGIPEAELPHVQRGAILHDIGKVAIPDSILFKPAPLTEEEWGIMRRHPVIATEILRPIPNFEPVLPIPRSHHEKWDGSGYPDGLAGEDIPLAARIFAFADVYDALTSDRPYRRAWTQRDALDYIREQSGAHFDPFLAPVFIGMFRK